MHARTPGIHTAAAHCVRTRRQPRSMATSPQPLTEPPPPTALCTRKGVHCVPFVPTVPRCRLVRTAARAQHAPSPANASSELLRPLWAAFARRGVDAGDGRSSHGSEDLLKQVESGMAGYQTRWLRLEGKR